MKKIGILTFARVANFGANLQGLSTYCYLKKHGFDAIFIDWEPVDFAVRQNAEAETTQGKAHFDFFDKYCKKTRKCRTDDDIVNVIEEYDIQGVIIGSDAVLQHHPLITRIKFPTKHLYYISKVDSARMYPNPFWGTFRSKLKRDIPILVISASSQNSPFRYFSRSVKEQMKKDIMCFDYVSVRDTWTQSMIRNITGDKIKPIITPDPVFNFNCNCEHMIPSKEEILKKYNLPSQYVLVSFLNDRTVSKKWLSNLKLAAFQYNIATVALPMPDGLKFDHGFEYEVTPPLSPIDWYALIKYSKGYVGQNMHPIVVALHNSVPVFSFDTYGVTCFFSLFSRRESSKIFHILKEFGCQLCHVSVNKRFYVLPSAKDVIESIVHADIAYIHSIATKKTAEYNTMMKDVVSFF